MCVCRAIFEDVSCYVGSCRTSGDGQGRVFCRWITKLHSGAQCDVSVVVWPGVFLTHLAFVTCRMDADVNRRRVASFILGI